MQWGPVTGATAEYVGCTANAGSTPVDTSPGPFTTTWYDTVANTHPGTLTNMAGTTASGWSGNGSGTTPYAATFDGTNDTVAIAALPHVCDSMVFSYETWLKLTAIPAASSIVLAETQDTSNYAALMVNLTTGYGRLIVANTGSGATSVGQVAPNLCDSVWHHVVGTCDGTNGRYYVDGTLIAGPTAIAGVVAITTAYASLASQRYGASSYQKYLPGSIATVRLYPFCLSLAQIQLNRSFGVVPAVPANVPVTMSTCRGVW